MINMRKLTPLVALACTLLLTGTAEAVTKTEAEAMPRPSSCWATTDWSALSGGQARFCGSSDAPLTWNVAVPSGSVGVVRFYGYRDSLARSARIRIDGGAWSAVTLHGASAPSVLFYTSPSLAAGSHSVQIQMTGSNAFTLDYGTLDLTTSTPQPPPPAPPPAPPPPPPPPPPPSSAECKVDPLDGQSAITNAIKACPDGTATAPNVVAFPTGKAYTQTDAINVERRANLIIDLNGSTFTKSSAAASGANKPNWRIIEGSNVTLRDGRIKGALLDGPRGVPPSNENQWEHGVYLLGGTGHKVEDLQVDDVYGDGVAIAPSGYHYFGDVLRGQQPSDHVVQRVRVESARRMCIAPTAGTRITVQDNTLIDCRYAGIDMETDVAGEKLHDIKILRNSCNGYYLFCIGAAGPVNERPLPDDIKNIEIRGNTTVTASDTCWEPVHIERGPVTNVIVNDNPGFKSQGDGVELIDVQGGSVAGNTLTLTKGLHWCNSPSVPSRLGGTTRGIVVGPNTTVGY